MNQNCVNNLEPSDLWSRKGSGLTIDAMLPPYNLRVGQEDELTPPWGVTGVWGSKIPCNETSEPLDGLKTPPDSACIAPMVQASPIAKPVTGSLVGEKNTQSVSVDALLALRQPPIPQPGDACPPPPGLVAGLSSFRDGSVEPFPCQTEVPISIGSCGHPDSCSAACRYVKRKGGCREGENCPNCHLCHWQRPKLRAKAQWRRKPELSMATQTTHLMGRMSPRGQTVVGHCSWIPTFPLLRGVLSQLRRRVRTCACQPCPWAPSATLTLVPQLANITPRRLAAKMVINVRAATCASGAATVKRLLRF